MAAVELWWLPVGAGGRSVRLNAMAFELWAARRQRRDRCELLHAGLTVDLDDTSYAVEMAPAWGGPAGDRGVVGSGPVGWAVLGRSRWFRYEVRCWRGGVIPDLAYARGGPLLATSDERVARRVLEQIARVPLPTWGRDQLGLGEMWNSNSVVAWALATAGVDHRGIRAPEGCRAPGWGAGIELARRQAA